MTDPKTIAIISKLPPYTEPLPPEFEPLDVVTVDGVINGREIAGAGVRMLDKDGIASNVCVFDQELKGTFFTSYQGQAIVFGDFSEPTKTAIVGINNAYALHKALADDGDYACVLCLPDNHQDWFNLLIKHHKPQRIYTTHTQRDKIIFDDGELVSTVADLEIELGNGELLDVLGAEDTVIIKQEWGDIAPLSQKTTRNNPYPIDAFGELAGVVKRLAYHCQVPNSMAGQAVLGVLSTVGQSLVNAPFGHNHQPTSLFLLTQAPSGAGKSHVQKLAYKAIHDCDENNYTLFKEQMTAWEFESIGAVGKAKAEFILNNPKPINPQMVIDDGTLEAVLDRYVLDDRENLVWANAEAGKFFGGHTMKSDTATNAYGHLTNLYDGGYVGRNRSQRGQNKGNWKTTAYHCRLTIDMSGQKEIIEPVIADKIMTGQGLLPRFLFSCEPSLIGERDWCSYERVNANPYNDGELIAFWTRCNYLLTHPIEQNPFTDNPPTDPKGRVNMPFGQGAKQHLANFQQAIESELRNSYKDHTAFASRMAQNASRIATLLAFYDGKDELYTPYLDGAFALVRYSMTEWLSYDDNATNETSDIEKLLAWLVKKCEHTHNHTINKSFISQNAPNSLRGKKLHELLDDLESLGYLKLEQVEKRRLVKLNPNLFT